MAKFDLTPSIYTFENLRNSNKLYVDKTEYIWQLVKSAPAMYFLSRPRRFGKSLTLSTLKAVFEGKKDLFKGLAIHDKPYDWKSYPVIHLDNANCGAGTPQELQNYLHAAIENIAASNGLKLRGETLSTDFEFLIDDLAATSPVVILIDEYDKPILSNITNPDAQLILGVLKSFYSTIKKCEAKIHFAFVTGVTKFCHVSLFSDLNNLTDLTMMQDYATMLGYTQTEFEANFQEWTADAEARQPLPHDAFLAKIKEWYDGYRFEENSDCVYNPVSLALFFLNHGKFDNYWFSTGTPSSLMELIRQQKMNLQQAVTEPASSYTFGAFELDNIPPLTLLLQTGYLTIRSVEYKYNRTKYLLDFPNREVAESFNTYLLNNYARKSQNDMANFCEHLTDAMLDDNLPKFQHALEVFFAGIPYDVHHKDEANFQNIFFAIFKLLGYNITAESRTSDGRVDAVIQTDSHLYLFEFKLNQDDSALSQMKTKEYFKPFLLSPLPITLVGANFDTQTGKISNWQTEDVSR